MQVNDFFSAAVQSCWPSPWGSAYDSSFAVHLGHDRPTRATRPGGGQGQSPGHPSVSNGPSTVVGTAGRSRSSSGTSQDGNTKAHGHAPANAVPHSRVGGGPLFCGIHHRREAPTRAPPLVGNGTYGSITLGPSRRPGLQPRLRALLRGAHHHHPSAVGTPFPFATTHSGCSFSRLLHGRVVFGL